MSNPNPKRIAVPSETSAELCKQCGRIVFWALHHGVKVLVDCGEDVGGVMPTRSAPSFDQGANDGSGFLHDAAMCQMEPAVPSVTRPQPTVNEAVAPQRTS